MTKKQILSFKRKALIFNVLHWVFFVAPFIILLAIKNKDWITTKDDAISLAVGCILCLVVLGLAIAKKTAKFGLIGWYIVGILVAWFFKTAISDLLVILLCGFGGAILSTIANAISMSNKKKYDKAMQGVFTAEVIRNGNLRLDEKGNLK